MSALENDGKFILDQQLAVLAADVWSSVSPLAERWLGIQADEPRTTWSRSNRRNRIFSARGRTPMIRRCEEQDFDQIWSIINDGAQAYKGIIPTDCWTEPYMSRDELQAEIENGVTFWGYEEDGTLTGVMGIQPVDDVTLIRHAYVRTSVQRQGIGACLLAHLRKLAHGPVLIGTWANAVWAIHFYEKHGFHLVAPEQRERLLRKYWKVPDRQVDTSVVLADSSWQDAI